MRRREFIAVLGGTVAWPLTARAQHRLMPGFLSSLTARDATKIMDPFHRGLADAGYIEGQNVAIEYRSDPCKARAETKRGIADQNTPLETIDIPRRRLLPHPE